MDVDYPQLLTVDEVADRLRKSPCTLRYWRSIGAGPRSAKLGKRIVYREADVLAWVEQQFADDSSATAPAAS
jgi:predicted DNA-binding transcriptional regulator AlpA